MHPWKALGVARSGREPRYLPSELYLGQKEDDGDYYDGLPVHLPMIVSVTVTPDC